MIVDYIDTQRGRFGVEPVCAVLAQAGIQIAPSTYYARSQAALTEAELGDAYLANQLRSLWQTNWGVYGARKLWHASRRAGLQVGRDQVARLMRIAGITGTIRGKHRTVTTRRDETVPRHPDLVRRGWAAPTRVDQLWVADFSYVWTLAGFVYVAFVVDVFSRRILGWRITTTVHTGMVTDALHQALQVRRRGEHDWVTAGLIHHSDAGSQYVSVAFTAELIDAGIAARSAPWATRWTTRCASRPSGCSKPKQSTWPGRPGETVATSNGRSPDGSTGTTPAGFTPRSGTCPRLRSGASPAG